MKLSDLLGDPMLRAFDSIDITSDLDSLPGGHYESRYRKFELQDASTGEKFDGVHWQFCELTGAEEWRILYECRLIVPASTGECNRTIWNITKKRKRGAK